MAIGLVRVVGAAPIARQPGRPRRWRCCADHPRLDVWPDRPHRRGHPASRTQWKTALRKKRSFEDGTAGVVLDALDAVLVARGPESVIRCTDREFRTSKRARSYSD